MLEWFWFSSTLYSSIEVFKLMITGSNPVANESLIFKWRRVEGLAHYFELCASGRPRGFIGFKKKVYNHMLVKKKFLKGMINFAGMLCNSH